MTWRIATIGLIFAFALSGCSVNGSVVTGDGPVFGDGPLFPSFENTGEYVEVPVVEEDIYVNTGINESWGEPSVIPVGLEGPRAVADTDGPYKLDSGDRLRIFVYGQPNLSRIYEVGHNGRISIPLIGEVNARGLTTSGVQDVIARLLSAEYVRDPHVTVDINQHRPFFILGEVRNAGQYPYVPGMTIETAVAIAGGYTERASMRSYRISRRINGLVEKIDAPSDYVVKAGDTVFVYERFL